MAKLLVATTNQGKIVELAALLTDLPYEVVGLAALPRPLPEVEETGSSFAENALLKATFYHTQTGWLTLADDSGLEVDALGGRLGVYSARYAGENASDSDKVAKLLTELKDVAEPARTARFICVIALVGQDVRETFAGHCEGTIALAPRGMGGFGYDPVFIDPVTGHTFAELSRAEKSSISHRGRALQLARNWLCKAEKAL